MESGEKGKNFTPRSCESGHDKILYYPRKSPTCPMCLMARDYERRIAAIKRKIV